MEDCLSLLQQAFAWWSFSRRGVDDEPLLAAAARLGYMGVDLLDEALWPLAARHGLRVTAINGHSLGLGLNRREHASAITAEVERNLRQAERWKIPVLICFTGNRDGLDDPAGLSACAETLADLAPRAAAAGVTLAVELFNSKVDHPNYQGDHVDFGVRLCESVHSPAVRLLYDIYHMQIMDGDVIRTIQKHHGWFCHYHTAGNPGRGQPDATQELNYPAIYRAIAGTGYRGLISHEFFPANDPVDALSRAFQDCAAAV